MRVRGLILSVVCVALGLLVFASASALAAAPEAPEVKEVFPHTVSAFLVGVLNPKAEGEAGTYEFLYRASASECEGGSHAPESPGMSFGFEHEQVFQELTGLQPNTEYTVCLLARNLKGEATVGSKVTFKTEMPPEVPQTLPAGPVAGTTATLHGVLSPHAQGEAGSHYQFVYRVSASECQGANEQHTPEQVSLGNQEEAVQAEVTGLLPTTTYTFCLLAWDQNYDAQAISPPQTFTTTAAPPVVSEESAGGVGSSEATLSAHIAPGGLPTTYRVEYGPSVPYSSSTPQQSVSASPTPVGVQVRVSGLQAGTAYHFRFLASNSLGTSEGADTTFTTARSVAATALALPDNRAYELVSFADTEVYPPNYSHNPEESPAGEFDGIRNKYRAAIDGGSVAYMGDPPASGVGGSGATGSGDGNQYLASRGARGWEASDLELPVGGEEGIPEFSPFSPDLSVWTVATEYPITAEPHALTDCHGRRTLYSLNASSYHALVTAHQTPRQCYATAAGISADDSHILFYSPYAYTAQATEGAEFEKNNLYDSVAGQLYQVNILPSGEPEPHPDARFGGTRKAQESGEQVDFGNIVAANGSRVFWADRKTEATPEDPAGTTRLFVRENDAKPQSPVGPKDECTVAADACTVQIDVAQGGPGSNGGGLFRTASADGSKAFFTDESRLTPNSSAAPGEPDLYEYDVNTGVLTDLTPADPGSHADVQGVVGASEDGSYVYFVADGVLAHGANAQGDEPVSGKPNLYLWQHGTRTFIATLGSEDNHFEISADGGSSQYSGDWRLEPGERTAEVTPSGHAVTFMSQLPLTGYDNYGVVGYENGNPKKLFFGDLPEVFVYQADSGRLICASCDPGGASPVTAAEEWEDSRGGYVGMSGSPSFQLRWMNEMGTQVYFMTSQPLVSHDTNRYQDVYEWEGDGSGGCRQNAGCVELLSSGASPNAAYFIDASVNGSDVFFSSRAQLVPRAIDETVKLYDARVDGGFPEASLACTGTGCQGVPPAPPIFATPSSVTFNGVGNFEVPRTAAVKPRAKPKACRKGFVRKHGKCVKRAKRRAKKAGNSKRGRK